MAAPVCFASVASATAAPAATPRPRRANRIAAVIDGSMNTSKFAACPSCGANATIARTNNTPAIHAARGPYRRRASTASKSAVSATASIATTRTDHSAVVSKNANVAANTYGTSGGFRSVASS